jgi:hypothetical protein
MVNHLYCSPNLFPIVLESSYINLFCIVIKKYHSWIFRETHFREIKHFRFRVIKYYTTGSNREKQGLRTDSINRILTWNSVDFWNFCSLELRLATREASILIERRIFFSSFFKEELLLSRISSIVLRAGVAIALFGCYDVLCVWEKNGYGVVWRRERKEKNGYKLDHIVCN